MEEKIFNVKALHDLMVKAAYGSISDVDYLPADVEKVIMNGYAVVVYLMNGNKGVSQCDDVDTYDPYVGFCIAYYRAKYGKNYELKNTLKSCIESAKRKGYKIAVLKNHDKERLSNEAVKKLQRCLNALGYGNLVVDGRFRKDTEDAVIKFQKDMGIKATGKLDNATKEKFRLKGYAQGGIVTSTTSLV
jgi:hypothetical protein